MLCNQEKSLLINLSFLSPKPTGISVYARNLCTHLDLDWGRSLDSTLLISASALESFPQSTFGCLKSHLIADTMTPTHGKRGHRQRLTWTQWQVPSIYQQLKSSLLFSPVVEAPIFTKCRYIVTIHDTIPLRFPQITSSLTHYYRFWVPLVLNQALHIICNSQATARDVSSFYKIPASKISPILLAYDRRNFYEQVDHSAPTSIPYFFYVGRHDRYKNLHRLISAFALLRNRSNYQLWIAGSGDPRYTPYLQTHAQELGISGLVRFLGYVEYSQLPGLIRGAIAMVYPSLWEGFGFPVLEAMACGTPVITSNLSSLPEVTGTAGILIDPYNTGAIADAMQAVGESPSLRSQLIQQGLLRASQFCWEETSLLTAKVLHQFI